MTITIDGSNLPVQSILSNRTPEVQRTQQILIFLISIALSIHTISFMMVIYSLSINYRTNTYEPIIILCWILFFAVGMFVTQRYDSIGLFVFALLGIINIIGTCILIVFVTVGVVIITSESSEQVTEIPFSITPIVSCLTSVIFDAVIVIFAFKLWYYIEKSKKSSNRQRI